MLEELRHGMDDKIQEALVKIHAALIVAELDRKKVEAQLAVAADFWNCAQQDGGNKVSYDLSSRMEYLDIFIEKLQNIQRQLFLLRRSLNEAANSGILSSAGNKSFFVREDIIIKQIFVLEEATNQLSDGIQQVRGVMDSMLQQDALADTQGLFTCAEGYVAAAEELKEACRTMACQMKRIQEECMASDCQILSPPSPMQSQSTWAPPPPPSPMQGQSTWAPPPPPSPMQSQSAWAPPPPPSPMQSQSAWAPPPPPSAMSAKTMPRAQSGNSAKEKKGFLGLFQRKKQGKEGVSEKEIAPPPQVDSVQFSAAAPGRIAPGKYLPINIVMYEEAFRRAAEDIVRSHGENAKESRSGYHTVERESRIKVVLTSPDVPVADGVEEQIWSGKYLNFEFAVKIPADFNQEQLLFSAAVYINDIIATKLKLILDCERRARQNIRVERQDVVSAFVSYASQDRNRVAAIIQGMKKARPDMDIFFDIESLRSGQRWEDALKEEIQSRDMLFLCWSRHARDSKWVDMEWRYALESKGMGCIEPIPIESPDICPPPMELQEKHFNDKMLFIIKATMPEAGN